MSEDVQREEPRKLYRRPGLTTCGTIREITKAVGMDSNIFDGMANGNTKTS